MKIFMLEIVFVASNWFQNFIVNKTSFVSWKFCSCVLAFSCNACFPR